MNRTIVIGIVGIVVVMIALALNFWLLETDEPETPTVVTAPVTATPTPGLQPTPQSDTAKTPEPKLETGPEETQTSLPAPGSASAPAPPATAPGESAPGEIPTAAPAPAPAGSDPQKVIQPAFDVVRVAPTGDIVVAGRGAPGSVVTVYDDGRPIGQIKADGRGQWVMLPDEPLPPGSRELSLSSRLGDAEPAWSEKVVVVVVPETGLDVAGQPTDQSSGALVIEVPRTGFDTSEVLQQPPAGEALPLEPGAEFTLSIDVVDYDEKGNLGLSGRANDNSNVIVYLDNGLLAATPVGPDGGWRIIVERPVAPGLYTLRVDEMAGDKVIARLELPFQRADPKEIESGTLLVVVQPGNSLWRLARRTLGEGTRYTVIYQANRDRIRDPDLIYPGQVFEVPRTN